MAHVPRMFVDAPPMPDVPVDLPAARAHHLLRVLKRQLGDAVILCAGDDREFHCELIDIDARRCQVKVVRELAVCRESPLCIDLIQSVARGEKMDFAIQKAVEMGAASVQPVFTRRGGVKLDSQRRHTKLLHWQAVALAAAEQCGRTRRPLVHAPQPLATWLASFRGQGYVLSPDAPAGFSRLDPGQRLSLLIGPEGGLDSTEMDDAQTHGLRPLRLGPRILRTETAGIAALAALQTLAGDLRP